MSNQNNKTTWFLAQLKPNSHNIAQRNLVRQGFETFLPMQDETKRVREKFVTHLRPLFPGYIFIALDMLQGQWRSVNSTAGITRLVSLGAAPTPVPSGLLRALQQRHASDADTAFSPGDQVTVTQGPFAHFVATIESIAPDRRVWVLMDLMGAQTRVGVASDHLKAV